jgi:glycosyltransferase involved in cell wall biosynthesis
MGRAGKVARVRVLWVTDIFPHAGRPYKGAAFVDLARELSTRVEVAVLSPRYRFLWTPKGSFLEWYRDQASCVDYGAVRAVYPVAPAIPWHFTMAMQSVSMAWGCLSAAREEHRRRPFDLVHAHSVIPGGVAGVWIASRLGLPLVVTAHGSDVNVFGRIPHLRPFFRSACRRAARITAVSRGLVDGLSELGFPGARWIPNGVVLGGGVPPPRVKGRILFVGQIWEGKGPEVLLEAFGRVHREIPDATLDFVGEGPDISHLQKRGTVARFLGPLPHERVLDLMKAADVFCLPSLREGFPLTVLEAFAAGTPVVGSAVGGMGDLVRGPDLGILVPPGDPDALAQALVAALRASWDRERIRSEARRYGWDQVSGQYQEVYREAVASRRIRSSSSAMAGPV